MVLSKCNKSGGSVASKKPLVKKVQVSGPCSNKRLSGSHSTQLELIITPEPFHLRTHYKSLWARYTIFLLPNLYGLPGNRSHHIQASRMQPFLEHILPEKQCVMIMEMITILVAIHHVAPYSHFDHCIHCHYMHLYFALSL